MNSKINVNGFITMKFYRRILSKSMKLLFLSKNNNKTAIIKSTDNSMALNSTLMIPLLKKIICHTSNYNEEANSHYI